MATGDAGASFDFSSFPIDPPPDKPIDEKPFEDKASGFSTFVWSGPWTRLIQITPAFFGAAEDSPPARTAPSAGSARETAVDAPQREKPSDVAARGPGGSAALGHAGCGTLLVLPDGRILHLNCWLAHVHGRTREECIGQPLSLFHTPEQMTRLEEILREVARGQKVTGVDVWHSHKNGHAFSMIMNWFPLGGSSELRPLLGATAFEAISRKTVELALRERDEMQKLTQKAASIGQYEIDRAKGTMKWSGRTFSIFGLSPESEAPTVETCKPMIHSEDLPATTALYRRCVREKARFDLMHRIIRTDGEVRIVLNVGSSIESAAGTGRIWGTLQDITGSHKGMEANRLSGDAFRLLIASSGGHVFMLDSSGVFLASNDHVRHFEARSGAELVGRNVRDVCPPHLASLYALNVSRMGESPGQRVFDHHVVLSSATCCYRITLEPIMRGGTLWAIGGKGRDITEERNALLALEEIQGRFRTLNEELAFMSDSSRVRGLLIDMDIAWIRLLRLQREKMEDRELQEFFGRVFRGADGDSPIVLEMVLVQRDGSRLVARFDCRMERPGGGEIIVLRCAFRSSEERKALEEMLRRSDEALREAERLGRIGSWEHDIPTGRVTWSDGMYRLHDRDPSNGPPTIEEFARSYGGREPALRAARQSLLEKGERAERVFEVSLDDGRHLWRHSVVHVVRDAGGIVVRLFGTVQDISDRKELERQLFESRSTLKERELELGRKNLALQELIQDQREREALLARLPSARQLPRELDVLTARELQVFLQLPGGLSTKEVAARLGVSARTVESHRNSIRRKLHLEHESLSAYAQMMLGRPARSERPFEGTGRTHIEREDL